MHNCLIPFNLSTPSDVQAIKNIKCTPRELDILACTLAGRSSKTLALLLNISGRTVETHIHNLKLKLECNSREGIRGSLENSPAVPFLRERYLNLRIQGAFEKKLAEAKSLLKMRNPTCYFIAHKGQDGNPHGFNVLKNFRLLEKYLKKLGIKSTLKSLGSHTELMGHARSNLTQKSHRHASEKKECFVYMMSDSLDSTLKVMLGEVSPQNVNHINFLIFRESLQTNALKQGESSTSLRGNYYYSLWQLIQRIFPDVNLDQIILGFKAEYSKILAADDVINDPKASLLAQDDGAYPKENLKKRNWTTILEKGNRIGIYGAFLCIAAILLFLLVSVPKEENSTQSIHPIRSELIVPTESALLKRMGLISEMQQKLNQQEGIQTIALVGLVGMGGVGKTTLARYFGQQHESSLVWEINAETVDSLVNSFMDLAAALAKTQDERDNLEFIKAIQQPEEREKQLLSFVKDHLRNHPNWLLIFDNVDAMSEVKKYMPRNHKVWGHGKVIITSRNSNLQNSSHIGADNFIHLGELPSFEALELLSKILHNCEPAYLSSDQKARALSFLKHIPSFPLDVSVAAYYIKDNHITYDQYLEQINRYSKDFDSSLINILKEKSDYEKTRYGIISVSFQKLMDMDPVFKDLLLFICLLDSQNIPKSLLAAYKDPKKVNDFMAALRRYSLITAETLSADKDGELTFSLHRSTQTLGKEFLVNLLPDKEKLLLIADMISASKDFYEKNAENYPKLTSIIPHCEAFGKNVSSMNLPKALKNKAEVVLAYVLGSCYLKAYNNLILSRKLLSQAFRMHHNMDTISKGEMATMLKDLGYICGEIGDVNDTVRYAEESIRLCPRSPESDLLIAHNLKNIGIVYSDVDKANGYFQTALKKLANVKRNTRQKTELQAEIYRMLARIYSETYLHKENAQQALIYIGKALDAINSSEEAHIKGNAKLQSCEWGEAKARLGHIYCQLGKYDDAMAKGFDEALYLLDHPVNGCFTNLLKTYVYSGVGEVRLRKGQTKEAIDPLTKSIDIASQLVGESDNCNARTYRAEAWIRSKNFSEGYKDCMMVASAPIDAMKTDTIHSNLNYAISFYHGGFIKYKQNDLKKSMEHFADFFKRIEEFCKGFLDEKAYKVLENKGVFTTFSYNPKYAKDNLKTYLKNSCAIFTAIYGSSHPFVKDYIGPNTKEAVNPWYKLF